MVIDIAEQGSDLRLKFQGEVLVTATDEALTDFRSVVELPHKVVTLDFSELSRVDVTFFQLLIAYSNSLVKTGRHAVVVSLPPSHPVNTTADLLGIKLEHYFPLVEPTP